MVLVDVTHHEHLQGKPVVPIPASRMLESEFLQAVDDHYELTGDLPALTIPATLYDSLMSRLDRLVTAKGVAQLAATIGRQFSYALHPAAQSLGARHRKTVDQWWRLIAPRL